VRARIAAALFALSLCGLGCTDLDDETSTGSDTPPPHDCGPGKPRAFLISTLGFTRVDAMTGQVPGFDVDGVVSDGSDAGSCFKKDFVSPGGETGIDNQLALFVPELEKLLGDAVDGLVQGAINNGNLLILLDVESAAGLRNDECVDLTVQLGKGKPTLGTDGVIEAYQTFDLDTEGEVSHAQSGTIDNGVLSIGPFELAIPIAIFDVSFTLHLHHARFRFTVDAEDGTLKEGFVGGGIVPQEVLDGVKDGAGVAQYLPVLSLVLHQSADLEPDAEGTCQQISAALKITAVEAFVRP
jgi:hypothetical protein